jgi:hypothetical protein
VTEGEEQRPALHALAAFAIGVPLAGVAIGLAQLAEGPFERVVVLLAELAAAALAACSYYIRAARPRRVAGGAAIVLALVGLGVIVGSGVSNPPQAARGPAASSPGEESSQVSDAPEASLPPSASTGATAPPASSWSAPPPEVLEQELVVGQAAEFFGGLLIIGPQTVYDTYVVLTVTTDTGSCSSYPHLGESVWVSSHDDDAWFRLTVLSLRSPDQLVLRAEGPLPEGNPKFGDCL